MTSENAEASQAERNRTYDPPAQTKRFFSVPRAVKQIFDKFPLVTYDTNDLPLRSRSLLQAGREGDRHTLFIWTAKGSQDDNLASFNPVCLKWQAYLRCLGIPLHIVSSNNHASPSGSVPFVLSNASAPNSPFEGTAPFTTSRLEKWALKREQRAIPSAIRLQHEIYTSLIDGPIRKAWLYHMYLTPNFARFTVPSYIHAQTRSAAVRAASARELRLAAQTELLKHAPRIHEDTLYFEAEQAFSALDAWVGGQAWGARGELEGMALIEAALFGYTYLLLTPTQWAHERLPAILRSFESLSRLTRAVHKRMPDLRPPETWALWAETEGNGVVQGNGKLH